MRSNVTSDELKQRTKNFALRVLKLIDALPETRSGRIIAHQLGRSGTSVGANYRAACRPRSRKEFAAKIGIVEEEADESAYWMELIVEDGLLTGSKVKLLIQESIELRRIMAASAKSARGKVATPSAGNRQSAIRDRQSK